MNEYNWTQWLGTYFCERRDEPDEFDHQGQEKVDEFQCLLDVSVATRDLIVAFVWLSILIYTCGVVKNVQRTYPLLRNHSAVVSRYSLHDLRWLLAFALFLTHLTDLGDALLIWKSNPLQIAIVSLVLPVCNALVVVLSCVYFDRIEVWQRGLYLLWTCPHWLAETILNLVRWHHFRVNDVRETAALKSVEVQLVTTWIKIFLAVFLLIVDASTAFQGRRSAAEPKNPSEPKKKEMHPPNKDMASTRSLDSVFVSTGKQQQQAFAAQADKSPACCYLHGQSNLLSKATFFWLNPLLMAGFWTPLEQKHLGPIPDDYKASQLSQQIRRLADTKTPNLWRCYWTFSWPAILLGGWLKFLGDLVGYVAPLGIQVMVNYVGTNSTSSSNSTSTNNATAGAHFDYPTVTEFLSNGYIMAVIVFLSSFLQGTLSQASSHVLCVEGIRLKTALQSFMYEKSLRLSSLSGVTVDSDKTDDEEHPKTEDSATLQLDAGTLSQLLTEDCDNTMVLLCLCHYLWAIPLKLAILLYLLHEKLGVGSVIAALLCLLLMVPAQFLLGRNISHQNKSSMREAGRRLAKIHEWVSNMKLFRLYAWERSGLSRIRAVRRKELQHLWSYSIQWAWATFLTQASTVALTLLTFVLHPFLSASGTSPSAAQALSGLALINQFTVPLTIIPVIVPELIAACNSTFRLNEFFRKSDINVQRHHHPKPLMESNSVQSNPSTTTESLSVRTLENIVEDEEHQQSSSLESCSESETSACLDQQEEVAIRISHATFSWHPMDVDTNQSDFKLSDINLNIKRGKLTAIVGHVGSGKSSLLMALLGELEMKTGSLTWSSSASSQIGYVAQRPWLMHASLRDNILFGNALYAKRYSKVLEACALTQDVELFQQRDTTLIGSKGQNVSGGQKARISLARAIYSPASTLLLDDPFAALDLAVAQHVFSEAIQRVLLRQGRNVIMATHHMEYALQADHVIVLDSGNIFVQGPPEKVASVWPELLNQSSQSDQDSSLSKGNAKDRWNMLRLVTKTGYVFKAGGSRKEDEITIQPTDSEHGQRWKRRSSRLNALSIHMSHDLPLLTDEMTIDELLPDAGMACPYGSKNLRTRHLSSLNGPLPEALPTAPSQPRSISFSLKGSSAAFSSFVNRRRTRSRDRFSQRSINQPVVSLHPLADSSWNPQGNSNSNSSRTGSNSNNYRPSLFRLYSTPVGKHSPEVDGVERRISVDSEHSLLTVRRSQPDQESAHQQQGVQRLLSTASGFSEEINADPEDSDQERGLLRDPAAVDEERQYGRIPRRLYWLYARACGLILTLSYFCGSIGWQCARLATDYWLVVYQIEAHDSSSSADNLPYEDPQQPLEISDRTEKNSSSYFYLGIYVLLSVVSVVAALMTNILGQAAGNQGRKRLHDDLLTSLSRCHTHLFDVEPTGRILNRFSSDMSMIDKKLATTVQRLVQFVLMCLSAIVINVAISPWSLLLALLIVIIFYLLQRFFRTSARELQRLESLSKGPVVSHLTETLSGLSTVRAFGQQRRFLQTMYEHMDTHSAAVLVLNSTNRWLGFALDSLGAAVVLVAMLLALFVHKNQPEYLTPGQVGLAISYTLMTPIYLQWVVRFWSELEMYFNAVERVLHYSHLQPESESTSESAVVDSQWPSKGDIEIVHLSVTYHRSLEPVLRDLTLTIAHGQKIGICGRTGSGKSTLVNAIFRLADTASGHIKLNGIDIASLEPHFLRSRLTAVPQDTLIFAGTLRDNLDPENKIADEELWAALEAVNLKDTFRNTGLDGELFKGGSCSLSVGQQQLFSLARAALRPSPVLVLDEPSSALDTEAEQTLHHCLDNLFKDRTVILVAHRVSSLKKCDWVCVIESGQLVLQGTPDQVLNELPIFD